MAMKSIRTPTMSQAATLLIAALSVTTAVRSAAAAEAQLNHVSKTVLEIRGGTGPKSWTIRYGSYGEFSAQAQVVAGAGARAWFTHGSWLRLLDTDKGLVVGRW